MSLPNSMSANSRVSFSPLVSILFPVSESTAVTERMSSYSSLSHSNFVHSFLLYCSRLALHFTAKLSSLPNFLHSLPKRGHLCLHLFCIFLQNLHAAVLVGWFWHAVPVTACTSSVVVLVIILLFSWDNSAVLPSVNSCLMSWFSREAVSQIWIVYSTILSHMRESYILTVHSFTSTLVSGKESITFYSWVAVFIKCFDYVIHFPLRLVYITHQCSSLVV